MGEGRVNAATYDPRIHHRRSIRLKGHDYAGGGVYFVTICAHREFIGWAGGHPFGGGAERIPSSSGATCESRSAGATCVSPVREMIVDEWRRCGMIRDDVFPGEFVVMPDHVHGLIRIRKGPSELGHVIGAFKAAASRRIRRGDTPVARPPVAPFATPPRKIRIWHRNYYEAIVRTPEAAEKIAGYIRMNPWRCVTDFGDGLRGMGNPALWNLPKLGVLCSRNAPRPESLPAAAVYFGGFHSPMEKDLFGRLLERKQPLIWCPAWGLEHAAFAPGVLEALEQNRMLLLEMRNRDGDLAAAEERNRFVIENADALWLPHVAPGGMLDRLMTALDAHGKTLGEPSS